MRKNAGKLRAALTTTTERLGAKGTPIKRNITDPESATLKSSRGVLQGYIGVAAAADAYQVIVEAQTHGTPQEHDLLKPVIDGVRKDFAAIGETEAVKGAAYLADAGYNSERGLEPLAEDEIDAYIADRQMRKRDPKYADASVHKPVSKAKTFLPRDFAFDREQGTCVYPESTKQIVPAAIRFMSPLTLELSGGGAVRLERWVRPRPIDIGCLLFQLPDSVTFPTA